MVKLGVDPIKFKFGVYPTLSKALTPSLPADNTDTSANHPVNNGLIFDNEGGITAKAKFAPAPICFNTPLIYIQSTFFKDVGIAPNPWYPSIIIIVFLLFNLSFKLLTNYGILGISVSCVYDICEIYI